jgi:hypothetical protein
MVLQYVAASFHLPSVSTANNNTMQYAKPYQQYATPTLPAVVIYKVLLPQSNIMAGFVHSNSKLLSVVSSCLPKYNKIKFLFITATSCRNPQSPPQNVQIPKHSNKFNLSTPHRNVLITLMK